MQEVQETRGLSLGQEDPLEEGIATQSSILAREIPGTEELAGFRPWGCQELDTTELLNTSAICLLYVVGESQVPICSGKEFSPVPLLLSPSLQTSPFPSLSPTTIQMDQFSH